jgi:hypothetical protein
MNNKASQLIFGALLLLCAAFAHSQVSVAIAPDAHPQFLSSSGAVLSGGFLYTYQAGTTTLLNTYIDGTGTVQNPDPIPLDATGAPTNGSVQTGIWLANQAYKFCAYNSALVQQWCTDNLTGYLGLLNDANLWNFQQTFSLPIIDTQTDNQFILGASGSQTTFDFPPPTSNITIHMPSTADTMVGRATTDTLLNKTLTSPAINTPTINGCGPMPNGPGTYACIANASATGTTVGTLTKILNAPSQATIAVTTDTTGIQGICVSNCGITGTAVIQQSGIVSCVFDGATTSNDYVQISSTTGGDCHDAGAVTAGASQVIGRVLSTNASSGTYSIVLLPANSSQLPAEVAAADRSGQNANVTNFVAYTAPAQSTYRVTCEVVTTQAATSSSTQPACEVIYNDADTSQTALLVSFGTTSTTNVVGNVMTSQAVVNVKSGSTIQFATLGYVSSGATSLVYAVHFRLEQI